MRAVAEFIMRGRGYALLVAVPSAGTAIFFWVGAAAVGLVTLRKGVYAGGIICLWSLLPAATLAWLLNPLPLMIILSTYAMAVLLRSSGSWPGVLLFSALASGFFAVLLLFGLESYLTGFLQQYTQLFTELEKEIARQNPGETGMLPRLGVAQLAGLFGIYAALFSSLSLIIARYWQALLYNPGGFRQEFHALRLPLQLMLPLLLLAALCLPDAQFRMWAWIFLLPLLIAGIALVHAFAAYKKVNRTALTVFYIALILINPLKLFVCAAAVSDSWFNFRTRFV